MPIAPPAVNTRFHWQPAGLQPASTDVAGFFSGLGPDFITAERSNRALIRAAEGIWHIRGCRGFLMFNC